MDGLRATRLFEVLFDLDPDAPLERPNAEDDPTATAPKPWARFTSAAEYLALTPIRVVRFAGELGLASTRVARVLASPAGHHATLPFRAPRTSLNRRLTPKRSFAFSSADLADMKTVKRAFKVTMNDVALAMTAHALREYLLDRDELPERSLVAQIPVGVARRLAGTGGNAVAATGCNLQTHIPDPVERLTAIHASMQSAKALQSALGDDMVVDALSVIPGAALSAGLSLYRGLGLDRLHPPIFNAIVSNVPGPPVALYTHGARLVAGYTFGPLLAGCALNVTLMSYQDQIDFGVATCPDVVDDPWGIAEAIPEGLDALLKRV